MKIDLIIVSFLSSHEIGYFSTEISGPEKAPLSDISYGSIFMILPSLFAVQHIPITNDMATDHISIIWTCTGLMISTHFQALAEVRYSKTQIQ